MRIKKQQTESRKVGAREKLGFAFVREGIEAKGRGMATQAATQSQGGNPILWVQNKQKAVGTALQTWVKKQPPYVEVAVATFGGATQGGVLGGVMGSMSKMNPTPPGGAGAGPLAGGQNGMSTMMGGPMTQARNFAVMTGVHALIGTSIKKLRNGVEDVKGK